MPVRRFFKGLEDRVKMADFDIAFIGHLCRDEVVSYSGETEVFPGGAVYYGAIAAASIGRKVQAIVKVAVEDEFLTRELRDAGASVHIVPSAQSTFIRIVHPVEDVDVREIHLLSMADYFKIDEIPDLGTGRVCLAGASDREFTVGFLHDIRARAEMLAADMQGFVRQFCPETGEILFHDVPEKAEIFSLLDVVKLDIVEAKALTGSDDLDEAAKMVEDMGAGEVIITSAAGVTARAGGRAFFAPYSAHEIVGRSGRGDTTLAAYLSWRCEHDVEPSLNAQVRSGRRQHQARGARSAQGHPRRSPRARSRVRRGKEKLYGYVLTQRTARLAGGGFEGARGSDGDA